MGFNRDRVLRPLYYPRPKASEYVQTVLRRAKGRVSVTPSSYDPLTDEPTLRLWWSADVGITEAGTGVSSWVDQVQSIDAIQAIDTRRPTYLATGINGKPAVDFEGADWLLAASIYTATYESYEICILLDPQQTGAANRVTFEIRGVNQHMNLGNNQVRVHSTPEGYSTGSTQSTGTKVRTYSRDEAAAQQTVYQDGVEIGTAASYLAANDHSHTLATVTLGGTSVGIWQADDIIRHIMLFEGVDADRRDRVEAYLASDGGL